MKISPRAADLFEQAQARPLEERAQFVTDVCGTDTALLDEVLSLLDAAVQSEDFFDELSDKVGLSALADKETPLPENKIIGQWRLQRRIGRGGMGSIYLAERADDQFEQQAALKILPFGLDSESARMRFLTERQILARLVHDNIARLLDGGVTDEGTPYFVMDYVDGVPIDVYCDDRKLGVDARIRLVLGVLAAVSHAHTHLIVHRDIKPSNVLVTADGAVKLLDFGIAKLLSRDESAGDTREIGVALTPEFAAPEQLVGGAITTATDVYSLGLLLFALLAGRNPRSATDIDSIVALKAAAEVEPPRLSDFVTDQHAISAREIAAIVADRQTSLAALRRSLRGDLDNIMQKALAVNPTDRYATVADFAADLERYLNDEPVRAQAITVAYRVNKFVRRHRGGVLVASLMLLALLTSTVVTAWQMVEAKRQRDLAVYQQQRVQATNEFLGLLFSDVGPDGEPLTLVELLDRGVELLDRQYGVEDRFVASTLYDISSFYSALGADEKRLAMIDRATEIARQHDDRELLAAMLCSRARIEMYSDLELAKSRVAEGKKLLASVRTRSRGPTVTCLRAGGLLLAADGDADGAVAEYRAALSELDASPVNPEAARASLLNDIAEQYFNTDRAVEALEILDESLAISDRIGRGSTVSAVINRFNRAAVVSRMGEVLSAAEDQEEALSRMQRIGQPLLGASGHYAGSLLRLARYDEALLLFHEEMASAEAAGNERWAVSNAMQIGRTLARMGRGAEAEPFLARAEQAYSKMADGQERMLNLIALSRVDVLLHDGNVAAARAQVDAILARLGYPDDRSALALSAALWTAARVAIVEGDYEAAEEFAEGSYDIVVAIARDARFSADVGQALVLRGQARLELGQGQEARTDLENAVESLRNGFGAEHPETVAAEAILDAI